MSRNIDLMIHFAMQPWAPWLTYGLLAVMFGVGQFTLIMIFLWWLATLFTG